METPNFENTPPQESEKERQEREFKSFLAEQIKLPKEGWSDEFREYVYSKIEQKRQRQAEAGQEKTPEQKQHEAYERYLDMLGLIEEDLYDKKIIDLGSGEAEFLKECIARNITEEVYGIDAEPRGEGFENQMQASFEDEFPVEGADYVISVAGVSLSVRAGKEEMDTLRILQNALSSVKAGGEVRIAPIQTPPPESTLKGLEKSTEKWQEVLERLEQKNEGIEYTFEPLDIDMANPTEDEVYLRNVLVIKKRENNTDA